MSIPYRGRRAALAAGAAAFAYFAIPHASLAQEIEPEEVVVTSTPLRESLRDIAQPALVLGGDKLRREVGASIGETLAAQPGVSATYFGPVASRPVIRGLGGGRVLMLEDGLSALDVSSLSEDHAVSIEPVLAEQVEILKGPATLLFGSGAVGGVVNVLDGRIPGFAVDPEGGARGAFEARGDTASRERSAVGRLDAGRGAVRLHVDGFHRETDDPRIPGYAFSAAERAAHVEEEGEDHAFVQGRLENADSRTRGGALGVSAGGSEGFIGVAWNRFDTRYGIPAPHEHEEGEEAADVRIAMVRDRYDLKAERTATGPFSAIRLRGTWSDYTHRELEGGATATRFEQQASDVRLTFERAQRRDAWQGVLGVQHTDVDFAAFGEEAFVPASRTRTTGLFVFGKRPLGAWGLEVGARAENQEISLEAGGGYDATALSLSAGALWDFAEGYALSLNLTRSQRHPQAAELFAEGAHLALARYEIGDAALRRETARTVDLTLHRHTEAGLHWSLGTFYNDFSRYIFAAATGLEDEGLPVFQYTQGDARFHGFEGEIVLPVVTGPAGRFEVRLAADYVRGRLRDAAPGLADLPRMPPLRYGLELHYERDRLHLGLRTFVHDRQRKVAPQERSTDGYTLMDADVSYRFTLGGGATLLAFLRGSNLLDREARRHTSPLKEVAPLPGRSALVGVRMEF